MRSRSRSVAALLIVLMTCVGLFTLIRTESERTRSDPDETLPAAIARVPEIRTPLGSIQPAHFALLSDPSRIVVAGATSKKPDLQWFLRVVEAETGRTLFEYRKDRETYTTIAVTPDGKAFAVAGDFGETGGLVRVFDTTTYQAIWEEGGFPWGSYTLAWSHDGSRLAAGNSYDGTVTIWDRDGKNHRVAWRPKAIGEGGSVTGLAWSHDDRRIASVSSDTLNIWSVDDGRELAVFHANSHFRGRPADQGRNEALVDMGYGSIRQVHFSPDDRSLIVNSTVNQAPPNTSSAEIWDWDLVESRMSMRCLSTSNLVINVMIHPDTGELHTASLLRESDGLTRTNKRTGRDSVALERWSLNDGWRIGSVTLDIAEITHFRGHWISRDGRRLAIASGDTDESRVITTYDIPQTP